MADLGADLGYVNPTPTGPTPANPYAGMTDQEVAAHASAGITPEGTLKMRMYNPDNPEVIKNIADQARAAAAKNGTSEDGNVIASLGEDLGYDKLPPLTRDSTNDDILGRLGYSKEDITKLKEDPLYKLFTKTDGDNFMAKEIARPGSIEEKFKDMPMLGAMVHGADQSAFGINQLMMHGAHAIGLVPETTPALMDALAKFNELEFGNTTDIKENEYILPKIMGSMVAGGAVGKLATLGGKAAAEGTLAATNAAQQASRLAKAGAVVKGAGKVAGGGAVASAALTPTTNIPSEVSQESRDAFWQHKGEDAKAGAIFGLVLHGSFRTLVRAYKGVTEQRQIANKIGEVLDKVRAAHGNVGSKEHQAFLDELTPLFKKPEYAERELAFAEHEVNPSLGDISHSGFTAKTEKAARNMPFGMGKFREAQQEQIQKVASKLTTEQFDNLINTKWGSIKEIEEAAKGGGRYAAKAQQVLDIMKEAGTDTGKILKADVSSENIRDLLIKEKKYALRDRLAGRAAMSPALPLAETQKILQTVSHASAPSEGFMYDVGKYAKALGDPAKPKDYASFTNDIHNINGLIDKYGEKSHEGLLLGDLKRAYQSTLDNFTNNVTKYAKAERYGITAEGAKPFFKPSRGGGYDFEGLRAEGALPGESNIRTYADQGAAKTAGETANLKPAKVQLRAPVIVEGPNGLTDFKAKLGLPDKATEQEVTDAAVQYAKSSGHDGVVFTWNGVPRQVIDMTGWKREIGDAHANATKFYKEKYLQTKEVNDQIRQAKPDEIFQQFIQKDKVGRAQQFFDSLDDKGRAAIKYELVTRAVKAGTIDTEGNIDPKKVANYLFKNEAAKGVFFKGEEKWQLDGVLKLMEHAQQASPGGHGGGHGVMGGVIGAELLIGLIEHTTTGKLGEGIRKAAATAAGYAGAGKVIAAVTTNPQLRHYMLAASDLKPGSPAMGKVYEKFIKTLSTAVSIGSGKQLESQP